MLQNIRSLYKKINQVRILANSLDSLPLAACLTETWINEEYDTDNRGGVGILLKNKIKFKTVNKYTSNECQILTQKLCNNNLKVFKLQYTSYQLRPTKN